jgi:serine/threonine protein kinase
MGQRCPPSARDKIGVIDMSWLAQQDFSNTTIRRFDISRLIARGGMGEVYMARDAVLGRDLALKILRQDATRDADRLTWFIQEARAASALNHPHLIAIYDIGESAPSGMGSRSVLPCSISRWSW